MMKISVDDLFFYFNLFVIFASVVCTIAFRGIQFRYFFASWKAVFSPQKEVGASKGDMTPMQAFINTLSINLGNGSLAGMATAVHLGGPGAAVWAVIIGFLLMAVRFAEVYASVLFGKNASKKMSLGGPMLYLKSVPGGAFLSSIYGAGCLFFGMLVGNAIQANSIRISLETTLYDFHMPSNQIVIAALLLMFIMYVVFGGAARIVRVSDAIVPLKVVLFFGTTLTVVAYHIAALPSALGLMFWSAFSPQAFAGGAIGFSVQQAIRYGIERSIMATESGLGTAAILFGFTGTKDPFNSGLMGMLSTFVSTCVCFLVALCIVVSGVWDSGATSTALTIASFNTVFGVYGGVIGSFLSMSFGAGVLVTFAYITRAAWLFVTGGRWPRVAPVLYCICTALGALVDVDRLWAFSAVAVSTLLFVNLIGLLYLSPLLGRDVREQMAARN